MASYLVWIEFVCARTIGLISLSQAYCKGLTWILVASILIVPTSQPTMATSALEWHSLPNLPESLGVGGPFVGVHNDALIVAGGANFPEGVPWHPTANGGKSFKNYEDRIFVLARTGQEDNGTRQERGERASEHKYRWIEVSQKLPHPVAYGLSISTSQGLLCIGGEWQEQVADEEADEIRSNLVRTGDVFLITYDFQNQSVAITRKWYHDGHLLPLPKLPAPTSSACGALCEDAVYFAGGDTGEGGSRQFLRLNLHPDSSELSSINWSWEQLPSWNGPARTHAIGVSQAGKFLVFSGRNRLPSNSGLEILTDAYSFDPKAYARELSRAAAVSSDEYELPAYANGWTRLTDVAPYGEAARCVMAGSAIADGFDHVLVFGGDPGDAIVKRERVLAQELDRARKKNDAELVTELQEKMNAVYDEHEGFSIDILRYSLTLDAWTKQGRLPSTSAVTTAAVRWGDSVVIPSGEKHPGIRTPAIIAASRDSSPHEFGTLNWVVLTTYLLLLVGIGFLFAKREYSSQDFFLANGRIPWWAAGLSIFGTTLSAITYLSTPARSFATDWSWALINFGIPVVAIPVVFVFLPKFRQIKTASAYEYLEQRFHLSLRLLGSFSFVLFQLGRMGIVVLLPALALSAATGMNVTLCIVAMGALSTLYTALGGIEAVVWTDVMQVIVLIGGAVVTLIVIVMSVDGGLGAVVEAAFSAGKLDLVNEPRFHDLSWSSDGILVVLLAAVFVNLIPYTSDQSVIQRYLTTESEAKARKAIWLNALLSIPATILFFFVGSALWVFYVSHPAEFTQLEKPDQVFPLFIAQEMPTGLAGLVIAGVFAASMSSLDSSMHSIATVVTTDFYERLGLSKGNKNSLSFARWLIVLLGTLGIGSAMLLSVSDIRFLWDLYQAIIGLFLGTVGGLFSLGILSSRVSTTHAWIGAISSSATLGYVQFATNINGLLNGAISVVTCVMVATLCSYIVPSREKTFPLAYNS